MFPQHFYQWFFKPSSPTTEKVLCIAVASAFPSNLFHQCIKFEVNSLDSLEFMALDKNLNRKSTKGYKPENRGSRVMVFMHCTSQQCVLSMYKLQVYSFSRLEVIGLTNI